jgi:hypothetical protein
MHQKPITVLILNSKHKKNFSIKEQVKGTGAMMNIQLST